MSKEREMKARGSSAVDNTMPPETAATIFLEPVVAAVPASPAAVVQRKMGMAPALLTRSMPLATKMGK